MVVVSLTNVAMQTKPAISTANQIAHHCRKRRALTPRQLWRPLSSRQTDVGAAHSSVNAVIRPTVADGSGRYTYLPPGFNFSSYNTS